MGSKGYSVYAPAQTDNKLTINIGSFTPANPGKTALFGFYMDTEAEPVIGKDVSITSTGTSQQLAYVAGMYSDAGTIGTYTEGGHDAQQYRYRDGRQCF
mgnify:CR=1 FL=1